MENVENKGFSRQDLENKVNAVRKNAEEMLAKYNKAWLSEEEKEEADKGYEEKRYAPGGFFQDLGRACTPVEVNRIMVNFEESILQSLDGELNSNLDSKRIRENSVNVGFGNVVNGFGRQMNDFTALLHHNILSQDDRPDYVGNNSVKSKLLTTYANIRRDDYVNDREKEYSFSDALQGVNKGYYDSEINRIEEVYATGRDGRVDTKRRDELQNMIKEYDVNGIRGLVEDILVGALPPSWGNEDDRRAVIKQFGDVNELIACIKNQEKIYDKGFSADLTTPDKPNDGREI